MENKGIVVMIVVVALAAVLGWVAYGFFDKTKRPAAARGKKEPPGIIRPKPGEKTERRDNPPPVRGHISTGAARRPFFSQIDGGQSGENRIVIPQEIDSAGCYLVNPADLNYVKTCGDGRKCIPLFPGDRIDSVPPMVYLVKAEEGQLILTLAPDVYEAYGSYFKTLQVNNVEKNVPVSPIYVAAGANQPADPYREVVLRDGLVIGLGKHVWLEFKTPVIGY